MTKPRILELPTGISGSLWLSSMPGRWEPLAEVGQWCLDEQVDLVVCLVADEEIARKSPDYHAALRDGIFPTPVKCFPIPDYGVPEDLEGFRALARHVLKRLRSGDRVLIHCAAGCGRTGTLAATVLMMAGMDRGTALEAVDAAGSQPDTDAQFEFLRRVNN